jgi:ADP-ribosylglycohydrolase
MKKNSNQEIKEKFIGCIVGSAIGDALGAPYEGWEGKKIPYQVGIPAEYEKMWGYSKGQYTDDTQLSLAIIKAILKAGKVDGNTIAQEFIPLWKDAKIIGAGLSCTDAVNKLMQGKGDWKTAGTEKGRAGNGTAMRAAPIGLWDYDRAEQLVEDAAISSVITHHDERCTAGAVCIAYAVAHGIRNSAIDAEMMIDLIWNTVKEIHTGFADEVSKLSEWLTLSEKDAVEQIIAAGKPDIHLHGRWSGISPYVIPTVLICLYFFLKYPNSFEDNLIRVIKVGGDVDSTAAIMGAIAGAFNGISSIPRRLIKGLKDNQRIYKLAEEFYLKKIST